MRKDLSHLVRVSVQCLPFKMELFSSGSVCENPAFGCATSVAIWGKLWYGLKHTTGCVGYGSTWAGVWYMLMSNIVCKRPWAICLNLPHYSLFVATSVERGHAQDGPNLCTRVSFL